MLSPSTIVIFFALEVFGSDGGGLPVEELAIEEDNHVLRSMGRESWNIIDVQENFEWRFKVGVLIEDELLENSVLSVFYKHHAHSVKAQIISALQAKEVEFDPAFFDTSKALLTPRAVVEVLTAFGEVYSESLLGVQHITAEEEG